MAIEMEVPIGMEIQKKIKQIVIKNGIDEHTPRLWVFSQTKLLADRRSSRRHPSGCI